jgi:hypothetical protein
MPAITGVPAITDEQAASAAGKGKQDEAPDTEQMPAVEAPAEEPAATPRTTQPMHSAGNLGNAATEPAKKVERDEPEEDTSASATTVDATAAASEAVENSGSMKAAEAGVTDAGGRDEAASEPAASEPAASEPAASEPAASEPAASEPAPPEAVVAQPEVVIAPQPAAVQPSPAAASDSSATTADMRGPAAAISASSDATTNLRSSEEATESPPVSQEPESAAPASGKKKPGQARKKSSKGKFRETMWFVKGEADAAAAAAAEAQKASGDLLAHDKADSLPMEDRYKDDGSLSANDERFSLRTGHTEMMPSVRGGGDYDDGGITEADLINELKRGRGPIIAGIIVGLIALIVIVVVAVS